MCLNQFVQCLLHPLTSTIGDGGARLPGVDDISIVEARTLLDRGQDQAAGDYQNAVYQTARSLQTPAIPSHMRTADGDRSTLVSCYM
jgi:hypothetical protein